MDRMPTPLVVFASFLSGIAASIALVTVMDKRLSESYAHQLQRDLIADCEKSLPRDKHCIMLYAAISVPVVLEPIGKPEEKAKPKYNAKHGFLHVSNW